MYKDLLFYFYIKIFFSFIRLSYYYILFKMLTYKVYS